MRNTNVLTFTLRERAYLSTKIFVPDASMDEPGQTLLVSVDPIGALLSEYRDSVTAGNPPKDVLARAPYATTLAVTLSRFRRFKYIGTRVGLRPSATTGVVDPAHITQPEGGSANTVHPYDVSNMLHFRRWIGGNIDLPHVNPGQHLDKNITPTNYWGIKAAMDLDLAWMSDPRFMHVNVSQGFDLFARPMRSTVEAAPEGATSMWLFGSYTNVGASTSWKDDNDLTKERPLGRVMLTGGRIVPDGWTHNPLSCFRYDVVSTDAESPSADRWRVAGVNYDAPWFSDYMDAHFSGTYDDALNLVRERYLNPVCILRLPPAYGTVMYYTLYLAHYFAVKEPFLVNTAYTAGKIQSITPAPATKDNEHFDPPKELFHMRLKDSGYTVHQAICPDPMSAAETGYTADFASLQCMKYGRALQMVGTDEPTDGMDEIQDAFAEFDQPDEDIPRAERVEPPEGGGVSGGDMNGA